MIGTIIDWATAGRPDKSAYLIPLGIIYIVPAILTACLFFIPESPRWLILTGRYDEGVRSLRWLRPVAADVDGEAAEIKAAIDREKELGSSVSVLDMFTNPIDRRRTALAVCSVTLQAASGSMFIIGAFSAFLLIFSDFLFFVRSFIFMFLFILSFFSTFRFFIFSILLTGMYLQRTRRTSSACPIFQTRSA